MSEPTAPALVIVEEHPPGVLLLRLNRPVKRNALSIALMRDLAAAFEAADADPEIRCVVLTGDERAFSAGADIADQHENGTGSAFHPERLAAWQVVQAFPKPLIAAVNGYAFGGGNELAMLADIVIAGETAMFGQPEIKIGIMPGDGGTQRLIRAVGKSRAMRMILTGEPIDAHIAELIGLVAEVVPADRTVATALEIARTIAERSPIALRLAKTAMLQAYETPLSAGLAFERDCLARAFGSEDQREGMAAFIEKRAPHFTGR